jgi:integrase
LAANTINQQLAAVRRLAYEAADAGLLSPELAAGIGRVNGVKQLGFRSGDWLSLDQSSEILSHALGEGLGAKRDCAMLAMLLGCGLRRSELADLDIDEVQTREGHWAIVDLIGKPYSHRANPAMGEAGFRPLDLSRRHHRRTGLPSIQQGGGEFGALESAKTWCGTRSGVAASEQVWTTWPRITCGGRARSCVTPVAGSLTRFNSCWVTYGCRPRNAISAASKILGTLRTIGLP